MDATLLGQQSPPYTYPNPTRYFIFNFLIISLIFIENKNSCGSVVEHCVSSEKGCGFDSQGTHIVIKHV